MQATLAPQLLSAAMDQLVAIIARIRVKARARYSARTKILSHIRARMAAKIAPLYSSSQHCR